MRSEVFVHGYRIANRVCDLLVIPPQKRGGKLAWQALSKYQNIRRYLRVRVPLEGVVWEPDCAEEVSFLRNIFPNCAVPLVHRALRRD